MRHVIGLLLSGLLLAAGLWMLLVPRPGAVLTPKGWFFAIVLIVLGVLAALDLLLRRPR